MVSITITCESVNLACVLLLKKSKEEEKKQKQEEVSEEEEENKQEEEEQESKPDQVEEDSENDTDEHGPPAESSDDESDRDDTEMMPDQSLKTRRMKKILRKVRSKHEENRKARKLLRAKRKRLLHSRVTTLTTRLLDHHTIYFHLGVRCFYVIPPLAGWLLSPWVMVGATFVIILLMYFHDYETSIPGPLHLLHRLY